MVCDSPTVYTAIGFRLDLKTRVTEDANKVISYADVFDLNKHFVHNNKINIT